MSSRLKIRAAELKREIVALYFAARDPRTPWYAKAVIVCVVAYALSPIDLIPDPIPLLGHLDDLLLLPLGIYIALKMIPPEVLQDARTKAASLKEALPRNRRAALAIVLIWLAVLAGAAYYLLRFWPGDPPDARLGY